MKKELEKVTAATTQEPKRSLARKLAHRLTEEELQAAAGGVWTLSDNGMSCDGPVYVN